MKAPSLTERSIPMSNVSGHSAGDFLGSLFDLADKNVLVTGGSSFLGGEIAQAIGAIGAARVFLTSRTKERAEEKAKALAGAVPWSETEFVGLPCEVTNLDSIAQLRSAIEATGVKALDVLIHAAGGNAPGATVLDDQTIADVDPTAFDDIVKLNYHSAVYVMREFASMLGKSGDASVLLFGSEAALQTLSRVIGYAGAKAAVHNFTRWLAADCARKEALYGGKIRVNAIVPGFFVTEQNRAFLVNEDGTYTARGQAVINATPMARFGDPQELVAAALTLCAPKGGAFITGSCFVVDGGYDAIQV